MPKFSAIKIIFLCYPYLPSYKFLLPPARIASSIFIYPRKADQTSFSSITRSSSGDLLPDRLGGTVPLLSGGNSLSFVVPTRVFHAGTCSANILSTSSRVFPAVSGNARNTCIDIAKQKTPKIIYTFHWIFWNAGGTKYPRAKLNNCLIISGFYEVKEPLHTQLQETAKETALLL